MRQSLVSVIIPTYNRLMLLGELIEALNRQTFQDFEVIIVNDAGKSVDIIKELYPNLNIIIVEMKENSKHVHARNQGMMRANGELIMLIDDDDLIVPTHMETMVNAIMGYDFVYSDVEIVNFHLENGVRIPTNRLMFAYNLNLEAMKRFSTFVSSGCLYRRKIHNEIGFFDPEVHNYWDWDFFLRVAENYQVNRVPIAGVLYDFSDANNNQSKDHSSSSRRFYLDALSKKHNLGELPTKNFFLLLDEPEVKQREAKSEQIWDGEPFISKLCQTLKPS